MVNENRKSKVERFLRIAGHDPVYSFECEALVHHWDEDELVIRFQGCGPDDAYAGVCVISDSKFEFAESIAMGGKLYTVGTSDETPMDNPWVESVAHFDEASAEVIREFIGAM